MGSLKAEDYTNWVHHQFFGVFAKAPPDGLADLNETDRRTIHTFVMSQLHGLNDEAGAFVIGGVAQRR